MKREKIILIQLEGQEKINIKLFSEIHITSKHSFLHKVLRVWYILSSSNRQSWRQ